MAEFWTRFARTAVVPAAAGLCFAAFATLASGAAAAPIYDMRGLLNEANPFLQPPPSAPAPAPAEPRPATAVPVLRPGTQPARPSGAQPAAGPMHLPRSFEQPSGQPGAPSEIQWRRKRPAEPAPVPAPAPGGKKPGSSYYEVRIGALAHDQGVFSSNKEDGYDANLEFLFASPDLFDIIFSPRPHLGVTYNAYGDTSQAYLGLTWEWDFWEDFFAGFSFGGAVHDGKLELNGFKAPQRSSKKELGCRVLFRESITFGYRLTEHHSLMGFADHISNASLCNRNEGLETVGLRYGYRF